MTLSCVGNEPEGIRESRKPHRIHGSSRDHSISHSRHRRLRKVDGPGEGNKTKQKPVAPIDL